MSKSQVNVAPIRPLSGVNAHHPIITYALVDGVSAPLSYRDSMIWDFSPYINIEIKDRSSCVIRWSSIPEQWRDSLRDVISAYWIEGLPNNGLPQATSVISTFGHLSRFVKWLNNYSLHRFSEISPVHFTEYVRVVKESGKEPSYQVQIFLAIENGTSS